jgi:hypothetical protein
MPIQYLLDDTKRRIRLTLIDPITVAHLLASYGPRWPFRAQALV